MTDRDSLERLRDHKSKKLYLLEKTIWEFNSELLNEVKITEDSDSDLKVLIHQLFKCVSRRAKELDVLEKALDEIQE